MPQIKGEEGFVGKEGEGIWLQFNEHFDGWVLTPRGPSLHFPVISALQDVLLCDSVSGAHTVLEQLHFIPLLMHNL